MMTKLIIIIQLKIMGDGGGVDKPLYIGGGCEGDIFYLSYTVSCKVYATN